MSPDFADLHRLIDEGLAGRSAAHRLRTRRPLRILSSTHVAIGDKLYVNFASNNYLGLTHHPALIAAARESLEADGVGSGAAALITGHTTAHSSAEAAIAAWKGTQDAVLLPSGYQANHAAVQALAALAAPRGGARFLVDKLAHASLLDAIRATGTSLRVFPHNYLAKVKRLLESAPPDQLQVVVTESIFSMDGDAADLPGLVALKRRRPFVLLLDEAHGSGVYGPTGAGLVAELDLRAHVDVSVVTLSKALGSVGGAVCASTEFCAALVNHGRAYVFSTSVPPFVAAVARAAIDVMRAEPQRQTRVRGLARHVRSEIAAMGIAVPPGDSPIIPVILGDESRALAASKYLSENGLIVPAVRPPTVAKGSSRLRVTLSCDHTDQEVSTLLEALRKLRG